MASQHIVYFGLGSNLGDRQANLVEAVQSLRAQVHMDQLSSVYETEPAYVTDQPRFLNMAARGVTALKPDELLAFLKRIEQRMGRRQTERYGPRPIDLDILSFDGHCVTDTEHELIVPHPRFHERRFALEPVAELDPGLLPWRNCSDLRVDVSVADLLATVANQEVMRVGGPDWADPQSRS